MKRLLMHVGQDKTGSSFLQSCLAKSQDKLSGIGIDYPSTENILKAKDGKITSGNGVLLEDVSRIHSKDYHKDSILFSSEMLYRKLPDPDYFNEINVILRQRLGFESINLLLFIRDPIDHFQSSYQQAIKRGGYTESLTMFATTYKRHINAVRKFVKFCELNRELLNLRIINYTQKRNSIVTQFEDWLDIERGTLSLPSGNAVNRSMTLAELEFQRLANEKYGKAARSLSDQLCENLPNIAADQLFVERDIRDLVTDSTKLACQEIDEISQSMSKQNDTYSSAEYAAPADSLNYKLTKEQIEIIFKSLYSMFNTF